jgi:hypothetical protein
MMASTSMEVAAIKENSRANVSEVRIPGSLLGLFKADGRDVCVLLGEAARLGLEEESRPSAPSAAPSGEAVRDHVISGFIYHFGWCWYLTLRLDRLRSDNRELQEEIDRLEGQL